MSDSRPQSSDTLFILFVGAAIGAAAGMLFAPRTGRETRRRVRGWVDEMEENLRDEDMESLWGKGKDVLREKAGEVKGRVEEALREKADEVRGHVENSVREKTDVLKGKVRDVLREKAGNGSKDDEDDLSGA